MIHNADIGPPCNADAAVHVNLVEQCATFCRIYLIHKRGHGTYVVLVLGCQHMICKADNYADGARPGLSPRVSNLRCPIYYIQLEEDASAGGCCCSVTMLLLLLCCRGVEADWKHLLHEDLCGICSCSMPLHMHPNAAM